MGVAPNGWATRACVTGSPKVTLYSSPKISYLIENTMKNNEPVISIKAQVALGEVQLENVQLVEDVRKVKAMDPVHFNELCSQYYSGFIYGGVIQISRKIKEGAPERESLSFDHSESIEKLLHESYAAFQGDIKAGGFYMHMNPIDEEMLQTAGVESDVSRVLEFVQAFQNKKAESQNVIQPLKSIIEN